MEGDGHEPAKKKRKLEASEDGVSSATVPLLENNQEDNTIIYDNTADMVPAINSTSLLESLPVELLHIIISYLSTCDKVYLRMVCRRLRFVLDDPAHWRRVIIPPYINARNHRYVRLVLKHTKSHVRSLSLVGYSSTTSSYLHSCTSVTALDLFGSHMTSSAIKQLFLRLPNLARLSVGSRVANNLLPMLSSLQQLIVHDVCEDNVIDWVELKKPTNVAIKFNDYEFSNWLSEFHPSRSNGNRSMYKMSLNALDATPHVPSFSYSANSKCFRIPSTAAESNVVIVVYTAVSSSILSTSINYTHAVIDSRRQYTKANPGHTIHTIHPLNEAVAISITSLEIRYKSFKDIRSIFQFTPNLRILNASNIDFSRAPLDALFQLLSIYCPKITSIFATADPHDHYECYMEEDVKEVWNSISSFRHLELLSVCSCLFLHPGSYCQEDINVELKLPPRVSFRSLVLYIHIAEQANLDSIFTLLGDIHCLRVLHIYIDYDTPCWGNKRPINLEYLLSFTDLEELGIFVSDSSCSVMGKRLIHSPAIGRLKCLMLENVLITKEFFTNLIPTQQQNRNLQMLLLTVQRLDPSKIIQVLKRCPLLTTFTVLFHSSFKSHGFVDHCIKAAKTTAKQLKLFTYVCKKLQD